jgi:hypothetical protein
VQGHRVDVLGGRRAEGGEQGGVLGEQGGVAADAGLVDVEQTRLFFEEVMSPPPLGGLAGGVDALGGEDVGEQVVLSRTR